MVVRSRGRHPLDLAQHVAVELLVGLGSPQRHGAQPLAQLADRSHKVPDGEVVPDVLVLEQAGENGHLGVRDHKAALRVEHRVDVVTHDGRLHLAALAIHRHHLERDVRVDHAVHEPPAQLRRHVDGAHELDAQRARHRRAAARRQLAGGAQDLGFQHVAAAAVEVKEAGVAPHRGVKRLEVEGHQLAAELPGGDGAVVGRVHAQAGGIHPAEVAHVVLYPLLPALYAIVGDHRLGKGAHLVGRHVLRVGLPAAPLGHHLLPVAVAQEDEVGQALADALDVARPAGRPADAEGAALCP
mmetsp:Transcript_40283/g.101961  ORF Transcript_40283/g.101961 Transcript_40283/m.101961 type:complete len:298 (+) Transcript_40283:359-1252(+)